MVKTALMNQYREMHVASERPEDVVLKLYDGAIGFLHTGRKELVERNNAPEKARLIEKTTKILDYLQSCLDMERGGEIAENLNRLYDYMLVRLTQANAENSGPKIEEVIRLLGTIREGWKEICKSTGVRETLPAEASAVAGAAPRVSRGIIVSV
jgi:flagellar secretion chaperone FliS